MIFRSVLRRPRLGAIIGVSLFLALLFSPPLAGLNPAAQRSAAVAGLMAAFWIGEVIPLAATALFPLVLFPLLGLLEPKAVARAYADPVVFLMMGGFLLAEAMKKWRLHWRIALFIIRALGGSPRRLLLGFMLATGLLSMWISNTATVVMMLPIALSVIYRLQGVGRPEDARSDPFAAALLLGIAYASSCGGLATLVGTPPNAIFVGQVKVLFPQAPEIFFSQWIKFGLPLSLIMLLLAWGLLMGLVFRRWTPGGHLEPELMKREFKTLPPMSRGERLVLTIFGATALLWITRGCWSRWLPAGVMVDDSTIAVIGALALFLLPVNLTQGEFVLGWKNAAQIPWGVLLLFGGGFALALGLEQSGFAAWTGGHLTALAGAPPWLLVATVCLLVTFLTEVTSNTAIATIMMPIMAFSAEGLKVHPFLLMLPAALSASCAFMLPAATPPNAVVFGSRLLRLPQMAKTGFVFNLLGALVISLVIYFLAGWALATDLGSFPTWAESPSGS